MALNVNINVQAESLRSTDSQLRQAQRHDLSRKTDQVKTAEKASKLILPQSQQNPKTPPNTRPSPSSTANPKSPTNSSGNSLVLTPTASSYTSPIQRPQRVSQQLSARRKDGGEFDFAVFLSESNFLDGESGANRSVQYQLGNYVRISGESLETTPADYYSLQSPAWKVPIFDKENKVIQVRLDWEKSQNCGGRNNFIQSASTKVAIVAQKKMTIKARVDGKGEKQSRNFEVMIVYLSGRSGTTRPLLESTSPGGLLGCVPGGAVIYRANTDGLNLSVNESVATFDVSIPKAGLFFLNFFFSTVDSLFHIDCYYDITLEF
jgi:hypothetical protein